MRALRAHVPICLACLRTHVPTGLACLRAHVLTCQRALRTFRAYIPTPTCSRAIITNNKNKCSIMFFLHFCDCSLSLSYEICIAEAFNGSYDKLCTIKWLDFCFSIILRVIFKWLIKGERWIIICGS